MTDSGPQFPAVQPGGSLIIAWQIKGKNVLVVGGGEVSLCFRQPVRGRRVTTPLTS
ncbi:NAD(P)-dependent oxidoreductase, partial [Candidatus Bathyarchaeota archaeon]|nr:NAD(P)-dependent oxidoreductase [Candidatus Bathyarchaeota archaeon]